MPYGTFSVPPDATVRLTLPYTTVTSGSVPSTPATVTVNAQALYTMVTSLLAVFAVNVCAAGVA